MAERVRGRGGDLALRAQGVPRAVWVVLLIVGGLITALVVSVVVTVKPAPVSARLHSLPKGSTARELVVSYELTKPPRTDVRCQVNALGADHGPVGSVQDQATATTGTDRTSLRTVRIPTTARGVSAEIVGCHITAHR